MKRLSKSVLSIWFLNDSCRLFCFFSSAVLLVNHFLRPLLELRWYTKPKFKIKWFFWIWDSDFWTTKSWMAKNGPHGQIRAVQTWWKSRPRPNNHFKLVTESHFTVRVRKISSFEKVSCLSYLTTISLYFKVKQFENSHVSNNDRVNDLIESYILVFFSLRYYLDLRFWLDLKSWNVHVWFRWPWDVY